MSTCLINQTVRIGFYDVEHTIGKGNFAVVKLGRHRVTKTEVAIKIIDKTRLDKLNLEKMYREIRILKSLNHRHIIKLFQVMETKNMLYLVTEYAPNGEMFDYIAKRGRLSEDEARQKFWQIISAVEYCHSVNIVHRDLKAENLLFDADWSVKLADFGFSNYYSNNYELNTFCGSPPYAAPEVFEGKKYYGPEIDVWSLGVILYVLVCGVLPFDAPNLPLLRDRVLSGRFRVPYFMSSDCENLIRKLVTVDPTKRYTIKQIKNHKWMNFLCNTQNQDECNTTRTFNIEVVQSSFAVPSEQILKLMESLGIDVNKTRQSLRKETYDNFTAIYLLLLERWRSETNAAQNRRTVLQVNSSSPTKAAFPSSGKAPVHQRTTIDNGSSAARLFGSPENTSFTSNSSTMDSGIDYSFNESFSSRQSTMDSKISEEECISLEYAGGGCYGQGSPSVEATSFLVESEKTSLDRSSPISSRQDADSPSSFESFDSQVESEFMASLSSNSPRTMAETEINVTDAFYSTACSSSSSGVLPPPKCSTASLVQGAGVDGTDGGGLELELDSRCRCPVVPWARAFVASDYTVFGNFSQTASTSAQMCPGEKTRGVLDLDKACLRDAANVATPLKPCPCPRPAQFFARFPSPRAPFNYKEIVSDQLAEGMKAVRVSSACPHNTNSQRGFGHKRMSILPDKLEYQPLKLLTFMQSRQIEERLEKNSPDSGATTTTDPILLPNNHPGGSSNEATISNNKSTSQAIYHQRLQTLHQKRQILQQKQARRHQFIRQASYQMAQKHSVMPSCDSSALTLANINPASAHLHLPINEQHRFFNDDGSSAFLMPTPLSPIADTSNIGDKEFDDAMDTS